MFLASKNNSYLSWKFWNNTWVKIFFYKLGRNKWILDSYFYNTVIGCPHTMMTYEKGRSVQPVPGHLPAVTGCSRKSLCYRTPCPLLALQVLVASLNLGCLLHLTSITRQHQQSNIIKIYGGHLFQASIYRL